MKIFSFLSAGAILCAIALTGCNNKPPFVRLAAAVDSADAYYARQPEMTAPDARLSYDEVTNTVKMIYDIPADMADFYRNNISYTEDQLLRTLPFAPFDLGKEIVDAKASVMIVYNWKPDGHSEYLIENNAIKDAYDQAIREASAEAETAPVE